MLPNGIRRLNWGCGAAGEPGWINSDVKSGPRIDMPCDIRLGLPLPDDSIDYAVSVHALQEIPYGELRGVLGELRRVLRPNGVLRLCLPDFERAIAAYLRSDNDYFLVPDDEVRSLGGKLAVQLLWHGYSRTIFTQDFIAELLTQSGFRIVHRASYRETNSPFPHIVDLDNRARESLFVEATK